MVDAFQDPILRDLITAALKVNYDVRIAATRIFRPGRNWASRALTSIPQLARTSRQSMNAFRRHLAGRRSRPTPTR